MNILVFGKDGQLGKAFQSIFAGQKPGGLHRIHCVGRAQCNLINADAITNLLRETKPNLIINAAAYTAVDQAEQEIDLAYAVNANAPAIMARYAVQEGATLLHYSTDYVFDGTKTTAYLESDARNPLGVYGKSKVAGEVAIEDAFKKDPNHLAHFAILRSSWLYGEGDNFIDTILSLAKERESLKVVANQYGVPTNASWLAKISLALVLDDHCQLRPFPSGIYHCVPQGKTTWHALACYAAKVATDCAVELKLSIDAIEATGNLDHPLGALRPMSSCLNTRKLHRELIKRNHQLALKLYQQDWSVGVTSHVMAWAKSYRI